MLTQFRTFAKTPVAKVLFVILIACFGLWGVSGWFRNLSTGDSVIKAGSREVGAARFKQMFDDELKQFSQQSGQQVSIQDAVSHNVDRQVADQIAADEAMAEFLRRSGLKPSDKLIVGEIQKAPRFFNQVSGKFDHQAYDQFLQQIGLSAPEFEGLLRDQLAQSQFLSGLAAPLHAPLLYSALAAAYNGEGRSFGYFVLGPSAVPAPVQPTDAQMTGFIKQNSAQLMRPESRIFTVVQFSTAKLAATVPADPAAVQKRFDFEKDTLSTAERRTLVEIPVKDIASAGKVVAALNAGQDPVLVAKAVGVQPLTYNDSPKTAVADRKVADAAFGMTVGQVQGPVSGDLGLAVLKVTKITPGHVATLDEMRTRIEAEVKHDAAQAATDKQVQKYEDARSGGASLLQAAKTAGVETTTLPAVTAQGVDLQRKPVQLSPKVIQAGFALAPGGDSDIVDLGQGEYAAVRLEKIVAPSPPPLDEIRPMLTRFMMQQDILKRLQAKADAVADQVRKGQTLDAAAASVGAKVEQGAGIQRQGNNTAFSQELLGKLFAGKPGDVVTAQDVKPGVVVAKLQAMVPATAQTASQKAADLRPSASQAVAQDVAVATRNAARDAIKPKVDYKRARAALGADQGPAQ